MISLKDIRAMDFGRKPTFILVGPIQHAMIHAHVDFAGRNWRRIKREVNKAVRQVRLQHKPKQPFTPVK